VDLASTGSTNDFYAESGVDEILKDALNGEFASYYLLHLDSPILISYKFSISLGHNVGVFTASVSKLFSQRERLVIEIAF
jgi:hypothetical protein